MANHQPCRTLTLWMLSVLLLLLVPTVYGQNNERKQIQHRAAFIFQMSRFVNWSVDKTSPLVFCFFKDNRDYTVSMVLLALEAQGKLKAQGHEVKVRILDENKVKQLAPYQNCALIYFGPDSDKKVPISLVKQLSKTKLTIGSNKTFVSNGGLSALVRERGKIKLYINRIEYEKSFVKIRSRLLSLARFYPN